MTDSTTTEISRFGITEPEFRKFRDQYSELSKSEPKISQDDGLVFYDWEAERLRKIFEQFKETDPSVCAVLAHMMWYVTDRNEVRER